MNKKELDKLLGEKLKIMRLAHGISCCAVGRELGVSAQQVQKYETGANSISIDKISKLSEIFCVPITDFLQDDNFEKQLEITQLPSVKILKKINQISEEYHEDVHAILCAITQLIKKVESVEKEV